MGLIAFEIDPVFLPEQSAFTALADRGERVVYALVLIGVLTASLLFQIEELDTGGL